jgi:hypothetical protein
VRFARRVAVDLATDGITPDGYMVASLARPRTINPKP